jgi:hypothetical protein
MPNEDGLTPDHLRRLADQRQQRHLHHASSRPLSKDHDLVGLTGEVAFAKAFGFAVVVDLRGRGDGRKDAGLWVGRLTFDVKAARVPAYLLREVQKPHGDILVLAQFFDDTATLLGWEFDAVMLQCPTGYFSTEIESHFKPRWHLRPMAELHAWVNAIRAKRQEPHAGTSTATPT